MNSLFVHTFLYITEDGKKKVILKKLRKDQKTGIIHRHGEIKWGYKHGYNLLKMRFQVTTRKCIQSIHNR